MKKILLACITLLFIVGCGASQVCMKPEASDSIICPVLEKMHMSPEGANLMFKLANLELIKADAYAKEDVLQFLGNVESVLGIATYNEVAQYMMMAISSINNAYGVELLLITDSLVPFQGFNIPISEFDKGLLLEHIRQQRQLLDMVN